MTPAPIRLQNFKPGGPSTSSFTRGAETMHVQSALYSRSISAASSSTSGGLDKDTIIFIVVGVVCLLVILIGFYFVSHAHPASDAAPSVPSSPPQRSSIIHPPRPRGEHEYWRIWKIWRHSNTNLPTTADMPTSQVFSAPATITSPSHIISPRDRSKTYPPVVSRPSQARRITSLSVATSFTHSHITEEELNNFRLSAYDLDGDLETEMLNSATDDVWPGRVLAVEEGCGGVGVGVGVGVEEAIESRGDATSTVEGSVEGYVPPRLTTQWRGGDYENFGAVPSGDNGVEGDVIEVDKDKVAMERPALQ